MLALAAGIVSLAPASASAAPRGLYGVVYSPPGLALPYATVARDFALMRKAGVQSARADFPWFVIEPARGVYRFDLLDPIVAQAAANRIQLLPVVNATPKWASPRPDADFTHWAPDDLSLFAGYAQALIRRYGPQGTFWAEHPSIRKQPIRTWQLWNEPSASYFWATPNYAQSYPALVRVAYDAIKQADSGAKVVLAGLASFRNNATGRVTTSWGDLAAFYRNGLRGHYDVLALNPFGANFPRLLKTIRLNRKVLRRNGDGRKPIWITELSWSAPPKRLPKRQRVGIEVSPRRQRALLSHAYKRFRRDRKLRVTRAFWFEWSTDYKVRQCGSTPASFQFTGLVRTPCAGTSVKPTALYRTYRGVAR